MTQHDPVTVVYDGDAAWVIIDNPSVNVTSTAVRTAPKCVVSEVRSARRRPARSRWVSPGGSFYGGNLIASGSPSGR